MAAFWSMMAATLDEFWCGWGPCRDGWRTEYVKALTLTWQPWIENPSDGTLPTPIEVPSCAAPPRAPAVLKDAPLPHGFRPRAEEVQGLYACVDVAALGSVESAYLLGGAIAADERRRLLGLVRDWRFIVPEAADAAPGWQRIRLFDASRALEMPPVPRVD
ncbi:MAG: hypothetical protein ACK40O_10295 [Allosphingosinicella sp.]